jgi:hypothetical protein
LQLSRYHHRWFGSTPNPVSTSLIFIGTQGSK